MVGQLNDWDCVYRCACVKRAASGNCYPWAHNGQLYKYEMIDANGNLRLKSDPYAFEAQCAGKPRLLFAGCRKGCTD
ncbi:hypothetical protein ACVXHB_07000 [Escherichia coli]